MAEIVFKIIDAYAPIYNKCPTPIIYDPKTRRLRAIRSLRKLIPWIVCCILIWGVFSIVPKLFQLYYILRRARQLGHFPSKIEEPFAAPRHLVSICMVTLLFGSAILISSFSYFCHGNIVPDVNAILALTETITMQSMFNNYKEF